MKYKIKRINDYNEEYINLFYNNIYKYKKNKIDKKINKNDKKASIIAEIILMELLKENYNIDYKNLNFKINKYGKPYIKNKQIYFNISHSKEFVAVALSKNKIGIDIEKIRKTNIKTINKFASKSEIEYILKNNKNIEKKLFKIYTLKEAYFKMKGTTLKKIKQIQFTISGKKIYCKNKKIKIKQIITKDYIFSIIEEKK